MPGYKGHCAGALCLYAILIYCLYAPLQPSYICVLELGLCTIIGALFPDIDIKSKGQKYFYWIFALCLVLLCLYQAFIIAALSGVVLLTPMLVRHRGVFHNPWFLIFGPFVCWFVVLLYSSLIARKVQYHILFFVIGALSHVWLDIGTKRFFKYFAVR